MITVDSFYKSIFHCKTYKLSLDAGCTCPVRDGTLGFGGCIFCSSAGSGDFVPERRAAFDCPVSVGEQVEKAKIITGRKIKGDAVFIAYFQSFTNTYGDINRLKSLWVSALECEGVVGLAIATRPDCLSEECLAVLSKLADKTFIQVELGLQTGNDGIAELIHRGYKTEIYEQAVKQLHNANPKIHVVTHIIFGLPCETRGSMMDTVKYSVSACSDGVKITSLYVLKQTQLEKMYKNGEYVPLTMKEYLSLLQEAVLLLPEKMVVHRLTGDPPKRALVAPLWTADKKRVLNEINKIIFSG